MTFLGPSVLIATLAVQSSPADSLRLLALRLPESALVVESRARPLAVREAVAWALAHNELDAARRLAAAHAVAWQDPFLVREVARFAAWPPQRRAAKVWADSVRRAGVAAFGRDGPAAAIAIWRRALARSRAISDTAGIAAVSGNIGAGFLEEGELDSAAAYLESARRLAVLVGDVRVEANAVGSLAGIREEQGDLEPARESYLRALALRERIGDTRGMAADHNNLGGLAQTLGDLDEARRQFETALAMNRREGRDDVAATNLVNLGGLASLDGDFTRAEGLYRDALATWRAGEQWADVADALYGLGQLELRRGDYSAAGTVLLEALEIYRRTGPIEQALAVQSDLAGALSAAGDLQGALDQLRDAERAGVSAEASPDVRAGVLLARADLALQLNTLAEAEELYGRAGALYREADDPSGEAESQEGLGLLLLERGNHARAQAMLENALRIQLGAGDRRAAALTRLSLGRALAGRGDTAEARSQLTRAARELEEVGDPIAVAFALGERAELEARLGRSAAAASLHRAGLARLGDLVAPETAWRLHAGLGAALRAQGSLDEAARELRLAQAELERPSRSLALPERRAGFLADKWIAYGELARLEHDRNRPGAAFEASERLRARDMLELLARARIAAPPGTSGDLVRREQDLRRRIAELAGEVEGVALGPEPLRGPDISATSGVTRRALLRAQQAYADLLLEMRERAPRHAAVVSPETATWRDVAGRLEPQEALVEYLLSDSSSLAFVVTRDTVAVVDLGASRREIARLVEFTRGALQPPASSATGDLWRGPLRRLHQHLIAPIAASGLLAGKKRLILVPHAELHYLPFAALLDDEPGERFLVSRYELLVAPSASVWLALGDRGSRGAAAGTLALAPRPEALPASRREAAAIASLADASVLSGSAATEQAFRREAPARRIIHLATYGVLNKHNPLFSYIELAPGAGHDGRLEVHEVFGLDLAADLVVLSACQTGLGSGTLADVPPGDDWVGLTRAFLYAGAANVVATLWPVQDQATADLMERFYLELASDGEPARALAAAQRGLLAEASTAHPFYWAGFVTVGSAERRGP